MFSIALLRTISELRETQMVKRGAAMAHLPSKILGPVGGWRREKPRQEKGDSHSAQQADLDRKQVRRSWLSCLVKVGWMA
jgi:hypothetical protein